MAAEDATDSRERIMDATYRALIGTGYADLTMSDIAAESETSTSLLHYHFDTKEDLLVAFLDHVIERLQTDFDAAAELDPTARLCELLHLYILDPTETEREAFHAALVELRSQAPYNERYRERFRRSDALLTAELANILQEGAETGMFERGFEDPERVAVLLLSTADGARTRGISVRDPAYTRDVLAVLFEEVLEPRFSDEAISRWHELMEA